MSNKKYWIVSKHGQVLDWEDLESRARKAFKDAGVGAKLEVYENYHRMLIAQKPGDITCPLGDYVYSKGNF